MTDTEKLKIAFLEGGQAGGKIIKKV